MRTRTSFSFGSSPGNRVILSCLILLTALICSCASHNPDDPVSPQIRLKSSLKADLYGLVQLTVTGRDFARVQTAMRQEQDAWVADISIPPGVARHFLVEIFSAEGVRLYRGEATVDVPPEPILDLDLEVQPVVTIMTISPSLQTVPMESSLTAAVGIHGLPGLQRAVFSVNILRDEQTEWEFPFSSPMPRRPPGLDPAFSWYAYEGGYVEVVCEEYSEPVDIYGGKTFAPLALVDFSTYDNWGPAGQEFLMRISLEVAEDFEGNYYTSESIYLDRASVTLQPPPVRETISYRGYNQRGYAVTSDLAGGYLIAGSNFSIDGSSIDPYLAQADSKGLVTSGFTWTYYRGEAVGVAPAGEGAFLVALNTDTEGQNGFVALFDAATNRSLWTDWWPWESRCEDVTAHGPDQFAVVGSDFSYMIESKYRDPCILIRVYDRSGDFISLYLEEDTGLYEGSFEGHGIVSLGAEGFAVAGVADTLGTNGDDLYLVKVQETGTIDWETLWGGAGYDIGRDLVQTADGGFAVVGATESFGAGAQDVLLVKMNASGQLRWYRTFGGPGRDEGYAIALLSDGGFLIAGETGSSGDGSQDAYLIRTSANGAVVWQRNLGGPLDDAAHGLTSLGNDEFVVVGYTTSDKYGEDISAWKIDANDPPEPLTD